MRLIYLRVLKQVPSTVVKLIIKLLMPSDGSERENPSSFSHPPEWIRRFLNPAQTRVNQHEVGSLSLELHVNVNSAPCQMQVKKQLHGFDIFIFYPASLKCQHRFETFHLFPSCPDPGR